MRGGGGWSADLVKEWKLKHDLLIVILQVSPGTLFLTGLLQVQIYSWFTSGSGLIQDRRKVIFSLRTE